jgi:hypothetical protein
MANVTVIAKYSFSHGSVSAKRGSPVVVSERVAAELARKGLVQFDGAPAVPAPLASGADAPSSSSHPGHPSPQTTATLSAAGEALEAAQPKARRARKPKSETPSDE